MHAWHGRSCRSRDRIRSTKGKPDALYTSSVFGNNVQVYRRCTHGLVYLIRPYTSTGSTTAPSLLHYLIKNVQVKSTVTCPRHLSRLSRGHLGGERSCSNENRRERSNIHSIRSSAIQQTDLRRAIQHAGLRNVHLRNVHLSEGATLPPEPLHHTPQHLVDIPALHKLPHQART